MTTDAFYDGLPAETEHTGFVEAYAQPGEQIEPVTIEQRLVCAFEAKPCGLCGKSKGSKVHTPKKTATCPFKRQNGCAKCGRPKNDPDHLGAPESFNLFASGDWKTYQAAKQRWHAVLAPALAQSGLPKGLGRVLVEAECSFGDGRERDQGNHRVIIEKALGDVLQAEGYIPRDKWRWYEFGNLVLKEDGENWIRLSLFGIAPEAPAQGALL